MASIILGGGCFWCLDASFSLIRGVTKTTSGFAGGVDTSPSYESVLTGATGHAEVIQLTYEPATISLSEILEIFFAIHNPTTLNRQGADIGSQYRSLIYYDNPDEREVIDMAINLAAQLWDDPIVTEVRQVTEFFAADDYHQDYFARHPEQAYCQIVINPKLATVRQKFVSKLK